MTFDPTKRYKEATFKEGQYVAAQDFNLVQDMQNYDKRELQKYLQGFQLKINAITNAPVLKVKANYSLTEGQVITVEMVDATHARWNKNGGAWSAGIAVTCDNVTWNTLGTSGLDIVFKTTPVALDTSEVWVAQAMRLLGGEMSSTAPGTFQLATGRWSILGEFEEFTAPLSIAGCANDDYLYIKVERNTVDYTLDNDIGHRLADGAYSNVSPDAIDREYTLMHGAAFPDNVASPYAQYIIVGKVISAAGGTFTEMWDNPFDVQQFLRIYGDTTAPVAPTGLVLTTGSEQDLIDPTLGAIRIVQQIPLSGYLKMVCNDNPENDIDYYEFKITRLTAVGGALTADSIVQIVKTNTNAGGMSVPLGVSYTLHGQQMGVPYRVWARAVDYAGNVGAWCVSADAVIGGSTCSIGVAIPGPTFTLIDTPGFVGVTISVTGVPVGAAGYTVWVGEGVYPAVASNEGFVGNYPASVGIVNVPWKENGRPYVRIKAYDYKGLYQTLYSESNTSLEATAQVASNTHNESATSHGGLIGDLASITETYGSVSGAFAKVMAQGFDIKDIYVVAENGGFYQTIQGALNAIAVDRPASAVVLLAPGVWDTSPAPIVFPDLRVDGTLLTQVILWGSGKDCSAISADVDVSNVAITPVPGSLPVSEPHAGLIFKDLFFAGSIYGTKAGVTFGMIAFDNCSGATTDNADGVLYLDGGATGGFYLFMKDTKMVNGGTAPVIHLEGDIDFYLSDSELVSWWPGSIPIQLTSYSGENHVIKGCVGYTKNNHYALANALKVTMNAHANDGVEHGTARDNVNFPVVTPNATSTATFITLVGALLTAYAAHNADALLGGGWAFHNAQQLGNTLVSAVAPTDLQDAVTKMNDLRTKYNGHDSSGVSHTTGGTHAQATVGVWLDSDSPVEIVAVHNTVNSLPGDDVTLITGSTDTNTNIPGNFLYL